MESKLEDILHALGNKKVMGVFLKKIFQEKLLFAI